MTKPLKFMVWLDSAQLQTIYGGMKWIEDQTRWRTTYLNLLPCTRLKNGGICTRIIFFFFLGDPVPVQRVEKIIFFGLINGTLKKNGYLFNTVFFMFSYEYPCPWVLFENKFFHGNFILNNDNKCLYLKSKLNKWGTVLYFKSPVELR